MWALITVDGMPSIQRVLDRITRGEAAPGQGLGLGRAVGALVPAVGLRMGGATVAQACAEVNEPNIQAYELPRPGGAAPRCAAIGVDAQRQSIAFEGLTQMTLHDRTLHLRAGHQR